MVHSTALASGMPCTTEKSEFAVIILHNMNDLGGGVNSIKFANDDTLENCTASVVGAEKSHKDALRDREQSKRFVFEQ